jgi:hypothetical protein
MFIVHSEWLFQFEYPKKHHASDGAWFQNTRLKGIFCCGTTLPNLIQSITCFGSKDEKGVTRWHGGAHMYHSMKLWTLCPFQLPWQSNQANQFILVQYLKHAQRVVSKQCMYYFWTIKSIALELRSTFKITWTTLDAPHPKWPCIIGPSRTMCSSLNQSNQLALWNRDQVWKK